MSNFPETLVIKGRHGDPHRRPAAATRRTPGSGQGTLCRLHQAATPSRPRTSALTASRLSSVHTVFPLCDEGEQSLPPQNTPLWDTDYFRLILRNCRPGSSSENSGTATRVKDEHLRPDGVWLPHRLACLRHRWTRQGREPACRPHPRLATFHNRLSALDGAFCLWAKVGCKTTASVPEAYSAFLGLSHVCKTCTCYQTCFSPANLSCVNLLLVQPEEL